METKKEQWILTQEGLYKYINNRLHKFKVCLTDEEIVNDTDSIYQSNMKCTNFDTVYNIPIKHKVINVKTSIFKLHPKSITTFIIEEHDDKVNDYYFESEEAIDNFSLLEDIDSFLSMLK